MIKMNMAVMALLTSAMPSYAQAPVEEMVQECLSLLSSASTDVPEEWEPFIPVASASRSGRNTVMGLWDVARHDMRVNLIYETEQDTGNGLLMCIIKPLEEHGWRDVISVFKAWEQGVGLDPAFSFYDKYEDEYEQIFTYADCVSSDAPRFIGATWGTGKDDRKWTVLVQANPGNKDECDGAGS